MLKLKLFKLPKKKKEDIDLLFYEAYNKFFKILRFFEVDKKFYAHRIKDFRDALWTIAHEGNKRFILFLKPLSLELLGKQELKIYTPVDMDDPKESFEKPAFKLKTVDMPEEELLLNYKKDNLLLFLCEHHKLFVLVNEEFYIKLAPETEKKGGRRQ